MERSRQVADCVSRIAAPEPISERGLDAVDAGRWLFLAGTQPCGRLDLETLCE